MGRLSAKGHDAAQPRGLDQRLGRSAMDRRRKTLLADTAGGIAAGLWATWVTDLAQGPLRRATPDSIRRREERISPGPTSSQVAARRIAEGLGRPLDDRRRELAGSAGRTTPPPGPGARCSPPPPP